MHQLDHSDQYEVGLIAVEALFLICHFMLTYPHRGFGHIH